MGITIIVEKIFVLHTKSISNFTILEQGKFTSSNAVDLEAVLESIKTKTLDIVNDQEIALNFGKFFNLDEKFHCPSPDDALLTMRHILTTVLKYRCYEKDVFEKIIINLAMQGGQGAAAHGCVIGGVMGAYFGYSKLPQHWLNQLPKPNLEWLRHKLNHLLDLFGLP